MPAKGRYFLNEGEEGPDQNALYEKYRLTSQHGPLLLTLLLVAIVACIALIIIAFSDGVSKGHPPGQWGLLWVRISVLTLGTCEALGKSWSLSFHICYAGGRQVFNFKF